MTDRCEYCGQEKPWPCRNTRDMEDAAIEGQEDCLEQLALKGGGEMGLRYVILNRAACRRNRENLREGNLKARESVEAKGYELHPKIMKAMDNGWPTKKPSGGGGTGPY